MLTLGLSITLRQFFRPKYYTTTIFRLKVSISKGLGYSSVGKTMTRDLRVRPAKARLVALALTKCLGEVKFLAPLSVSRSRTDDDW